MMESDQEDEPAQEINPEDTNLCDSDTEIDESDHDSDDPNSNELKWRNIRTIQSVPQWSGKLPDDTVVKQPIQYWEELFNDDMLDEIVQQSNLYATQQDINKPLAND